MKDFNEWSLMRSWMKSWLDSLNWYYRTALDPVVSIEKLVAEAPVVETHWNRCQRDESLFRFGLIWKCFDKIGELGLEYNPGILPQSDISNFWLLGGVDGTAFLVLAWGLEQPHAWRGVVSYRLKDKATPHSTIRYKTLGVPERQIVVGFQRVTRKGEILSI